MDVGELRVNLELKSLHDRISKCQRCPELENKVPLLFMPNTHVKIMVVTQGPKGERVSRDKMREVKRDVLSPANIFMYPFLYTIFNGRFRPDGEIEKESSTAYWTHVRKCFMEGEKRRILKRCSEEYLEEEIRIISPKLTIAVGDRAANFFSRFDDDLEKVLRTGLEIAFLQQENQFYSLKAPELGVHASLTVLPHPSGQNARFWKKLGKDQRTVAILEKLRRTVDATISAQ